MKKQLFCIYKKGIHIGNEYGISEKDAVLNYLVASMYGSKEELKKDKEFVSNYSAIIYNK